jgi:hypothetical protein
VKEKTSTVTVRWERGAHHSPETVFLGVTYLFFDKDENGWLHIVAGRERHSYKMRAIRSVSQIEDGAEE